MSLSSLLEWFRGQSIQHNTDLIEIRGNSTLYSGEGFAVFARKAVAEKSVLATIPKTAVLSVKNTSLAPFLEEHRIAGGLGLAFAVMHEAALGKDSQWYGYLKALPPREYVPLFWTPEELELLQGTGVDRAALEDRELTAADFETEVVPLLEKGRQHFDASKLSLQGFRNAASWIGSRAFGVDDYHGMAMVPLADIFNHKAAVVNLSGDFVLTGACLQQRDDDSGEPTTTSSLLSGAAAWETSAERACDIAADTEELREHAGAGCQSGCEASEECCSEAGEECGSDKEERGGDEELPTRGALLNVDLYPEADLRLHIGICGETLGGQEVLEILAACPLAAGQEIFNTFGELGNRELVSKYGFALRSNPFDSVQLDKADLLRGAERLLGGAAACERCQFLEEQSSLLDEDEEQFEVLPMGQVGPSLLVAARVLSCTPTEFTAIKASDLAGAMQKLLPTQTAESSASDKRRPKRQKVEGASGGADQGAAQAEGAAAGKEFALQNVVILEDASWFPKETCTLLLGCVQQRLSRYHLSGGLNDIELQLERVKKDMPRGEAKTACLAALTLVVSEKEILMTAKDALQSLL